MKRTIVIIGLIPVFFIGFYFAVQFANHYSSREIDVKVISKEMSEDICILEADFGKYYDCIFPVKKNTDAYYVCSKTKVGEKLKVTRTTIFDETAKYDFRGIDCIEK